jgi:hypothetical protein
VNAGPFLEVTHLHAHSIGRVPHFPQRIFA